MVLDVAQEHGGRISKFKLGVEGSMCPTRRGHGKCESKNLLKSVDVESLVEKAKDSQTKIRICQSIRRGRIDNGGC